MSFFLFTLHKRDKGEGDPHEVGTSVQYSTPLRPTTFFRAVFSSYLVNYNTIYAVHFHTRYQFTRSEFTRAENTSIIRPSFKISTRFFEKNSLQIYTRTWQKISFRTNQWSGGRVYEKNLQVASREYSRVFRVMNENFIVM